MKLTPDQIALLQRLRDSKSRGSASMSCDRHRDTARDLEKLGYAAWHGVIAGSTFYHITDKGVAALIKASRK